MVYLVKLEAFHVRRQEWIALNFIVNLANNSDPFLTPKEFLLGYYDFSGLTGIEVTAEPASNICFQITSKFYTEKETKSY
jgi:hypothetical protein